MSRPAADAASEGRIAALDGLRAAAMLLGVCLHASVSYMRGDMPGLLWVVRDGASHFAFDVLFWWLHGFRLPLFFFLAGFFAALVEAGRGLGGFMLHRIRRLLIPFAVGCLIILPVCYYLWSAGWLVSGCCTVKAIRAFKFTPRIQSELCGPMHLWFLEDLFLLTLAFAAYRWFFHHPARASGVALAPRERPNSRGTNATPLALAGWWKRLLPLWLSIPTTLILMVNLRPVLAHHNSFYPDGWRLLYYGQFFAAGIAVCPQRKHLAEMCRCWRLYLVLSVPAAVVLMPLLQQSLHGQQNWATRFALPAVLSLLAWLSLFGFLGLGLRLGNVQKPLLRYLADASYWIYLCHLPLVGLIQLDLAGVDWPAGVKFPIVVGVTALLALASYHTLVRYTFLGACLHGRRRKSGELSSLATRRSPLATRHSLNYSSAS